MARIAWWNFKIRGYGEVHSLAAAEFSGQGAPFDSGLAVLARPLGIRSCTRCHSKKGIRSELKLEHLGTVRFLVESGLMPPFPFSLSSEDKRRLRDLGGR
jgi:hypothetical protein